MESENFKTILYVDDEKVNLELFRLNFKKEYNVLTSLSGEEGIEIVKREGIKVVISDLRMPGINGIEMIEEIKKNDPSVICILLTAYIEPQVMLKAINEEIVFRYLTKPWKKDEVKGIIELAFERYNKSVKTN
jgi:response regulator RpfG family c-di-GMP phosphodiesterase